LGSRLSKNGKKGLMKITLEFQSVSEGLPPKDTDAYYDNNYSIECAAIVDGEVFDRSVRYFFGGKGGWVWGDMSLGHKPEHYVDELGNDQPTVSHWAPWPQVPQEVPTIPSPVWVDDDLLALY
jgi:hypothetical protein